MHGNQTPQGKGHCPPRPANTLKHSDINQAWLAEFRSAFEQFIDGEDGDALGRQLWEDQDSNWRAQRAVGAAMGYEDALAEADAWNHLE